MKANRSNNKEHYIETSNSQNDSLLTELEHYLYNHDAEVSTIGAMILNKDVCGEIMVMVKEEDFYDDFHRAVYNAISTLYNEGKPIDIVTVDSKLKEYDLPADSSAKLAEIIDRTPNALSFEYYAQIVREKALIRKINSSCQSIQSRIYELKGAGATDILDFAQQRMLEISDENQKHAVKPVNELVKETFEDLIRVRDSRDRRNRITGIPTGFHEVDDLICGLENGCLYVIAGRPSMGKTSLALKIILNAARQPDTPVMFTSLEMQARDITQQLLCITSKVNSHKLRTGYTSDEDLTQITIHAGEISDLPIWIDDSSDVTIADLRVRARRMKKKHNIKLLVVDYLQILTAKTGRPTDNRQIEISMISHNLKAIAKELDIPVIAVAQLNRAPEGRTDKKPMLSDLRESGAIEQDADVVMTLYREEYYNENTDKKNICELSVQKNRRGPVGTVELVFLKEYTRFENLSRNV